ncbi:MAG: hypothetical protein STSR0007_12440 [Thermovirga sp.]
MTFGRTDTFLPTAAEMAACIRDPSRKAGIEKRIEAYFTRLRYEMPRPRKDDPELVRKYGELMGRLRMEEETLIEMLEAFARGDAHLVRETSARIARR